MFLTAYSPVSYIYNFIYVFMSEFIKNSEGKENFQGAGGQIVMFHSYIHRKEIMMLIYFAEKVLHFSKILRILTIVTLHMMLSDFYYVSLNHNIAIPHFV